MHYLTPLLVTLVVAVLAPVPATALFSDRTPNPLLLIPFNTTTSVAADFGSAPTAPFTTTVAASTALHAALPSPLHEPSGLYLNVSCVANCSSPALSASTLDDLVPLFANGSAFSFELWFRPATNVSVLASPVQSTGASTAVEPDCGSTATSFRAFQFLQRDANLEFTVADEKATPPLASLECVTCATTGSPLRPGALYHVVATFPRARTGSLRLFLNGSEIDCASQPAATVRGGDFTAAWSASLGNLPLSFGARRDGVNPWLGSVYLFAVYGFELTPAQVAANLAVGPYNIAPIPTSGPYTVTEDTFAVFNLTAYDPVDTPARFAIRLLAPPSSGSFTTLNPDLTQAAPITVFPHTVASFPPAVGYVPAPDYTGSATFVYTVSDAEATSAPATAAITVVNVDDAPTITVPPAPGLAGTPAGFPVSLAGLDVTDPDAAELDFGLTSTAGRFAFSPSAAHPTNATTAAAAAAALGRLTFAAGGPSSHSSFLVTGALADIRTAVATLFYTKASTAAGGDALTAYAAHAGATTSAPFAVTAVAPSFTVANTPVSVVASGAPAIITVVLSRPVPCGTTLALTLATAPSSPGAVAFSVPGPTLTFAAGATEANVTIVGAREGLASVAVVGATGAGAAAYDFATTVAFVTNVTRGTQAVASFAPAINTYPASVVEVTLTLSAPPVAGTELTLTPFIVAGPGAITFDGPATFAAGVATATFVYRGAGPVYGNVTVGFVQGGSGESQYAVSGVYTPLLTTVVPQVDAVLTFAPLPPYIRIGAAAPLVSSVTLSAPVQPRGTATLSVATSASSEGGVGISGSPTVITDADGTSGFGLTMTGTAVGRAYGSLVLGGNSGAQFDTSAVSDIYLTRVLPNFAFAACDLVPFYVGENCTLNFFLATELATQTTATVTALPPSSPLVARAASVVFPAASPVGPLVVTGAAIDYAGTTVTATLPADAGGVAITSEPVVVAEPDALVVLAAPRWIKAGTTSKPFVLALPYAPRSTADVLVADARVSATREAASPISIAGGNAMAAGGSAGAAGNMTFTITSTSTSLTGTTHVDVVVDTGASTATLQYADPVHVLESITVLDTEAVSYISRLDADLVIDTEREVTIALTAPVPAGETLELEITTSGSGEVALTSQTRGVAVATLAAGTETATMVVRGTRIGHVAVALRHGGGTSAGAESVFAVAQVAYAFRVVPACPFGQKANCAFVCTPRGSNMEAACASSPSSDNLLVLVLVAIGSCLLFLICLAVCLFLVRRTRTREDKAIDKAAAELRAGAANAQKKVTVSKRTVVVLESITDDSDGYGYDDEIRGYSSGVDPAFSSSSYDKDRYMDSGRRY